MLSKHNYMFTRNARKLCLDLKMHIAGSVLECTINRKNKHKHKLLQLKAYIITKLEYQLGETYVKLIIIQNAACNGTLVY